MYGNGSAIYGNQLISGYDHLVTILKDRQAATGKPTCVCKSGERSKAAMELRFDNGFVVNAQSDDILPPSEVEGMVKRNGLWVVDL